MRSIAVAGHYAYLCGDEGFRVLDIANPTAPVALGFYTDPCASPLAVSGATAFYKLQKDYGDEANLLAIDISNPQLPYRAGSLALGEDTYEATGVGLAVASGAAYVAVGSGLRSGCALRMWLIRRP